MSDGVISAERMRAARNALVFSSGVCLAMLIARNIYARQWELRFYPWNLLLAWIPLLLAQRTYGLRARRSPRIWLLALCAVLWFFFFPNAPYIVTDLLHLKIRTPVPQWFDLVMMVSFAWTGLCLGYLSLYLMREVVRGWCGARWSRAFEAAMLALCSFGIYLGRFQRWNSWDVITRPRGLADDVLRRLDFAGNHELFAFCATFFAFSVVSYFPLCALIHLHGEPPREGGRE